MDRTGRKNPSGNTKIAKNAMALYFRMFLTMIVGLFSSRIILQALGIDDYGVYNVVGGFVAMFTIISGSLSSSISRFFTFSLGQKDQKKLSVVFDTSIIVLLGLSLLVILATETIGLWYLKNKMVIPEGSEEGAMWCFQLSLFTFVLSLINQPYTAAIIAHERMDVYAYLSILNSVLKLIICFAVLHSPINRLIFYAILLCLVSIINQIAYVIFCKKQFKECIFHFSFDKVLFKEMFSFAGWNFVGSSAAVLTSQGSNVLLNWAGGAAVNAAYGIAMTVSNMVTTFINSFTQAFTPQITKRYAAQEFESLNSLLIIGAKFSYYLMFFISLPLMLSAHFIISLWLGEVPQYTVGFMIFLIISNLFDTISRPVVNAKNATGNIKNYQIVVGGILLLVLPLAYISIKLDFPIVSVTGIAAVISLVAVLARMFMLRGDFPGWSSRVFMEKVVIRVLVVSLISSIIPIICHFIIPYGWINFLSVSIISLCSSATIILFLGCDKWERKYIYSKIKNISIKLRHKIHLV